MAVHDYNEESIAKFKYESSDYWIYCRRKSNKCRSNCVTSILFGDNDSKTGF